MHFRAVFILVNFFAVEQLICVHGLNRIVNGQNAVPKQFPYQVFYDLLIDSQWIPYCGGTIISKRVIVTAAHCIHPSATEIKIYFGTINRGNPDEEGQLIRQLNKTDLVIHEKYNNLTHKNDIALIKLPFELEFNEYIQPAKLPNEKKSYAHVEVVTSGWGQINSAGKYADVLQYFISRTISNRECRKLDRKLLSSEICLSLKKTGSTCHGDSGGPLVLNDNSHTLIGIVKREILKCHPNAPNIFTRVSKYLNWLESKINSP